MVNLKTAFKKNTAVTTAILIVLILIVGSLAYLVASGKISADTMSGYSVTADPTQGEVFYSSVSDEIAPNQLKVSAIPINASLKFDHWESSNDNCLFLDSSKAVTIAKVNGNCAMSAKFSAVEMTSDKTEYTEICAVADLEKVRNNLTGKYIQTCDIDLTGVNFNPIGTFTTNTIIGHNAENPGIFKGTYDGNGKIISNLKIDKTDTNVGLFRANRGTIKNVTLRGVDVTGGSENTAGLVGKNLSDGTVSNSIVVGKVTARIANNMVRSVGAITGENEGTIEHCLTKAEVNSDVASSSAKATVQYFGGLVGANYGGLVDSSYSLGLVSGAVNSVGGLVGYNFGGFKTWEAGKVGQNARITNSYSGTDVTAYTGGEYNPCVIGGLVGYSGSFQKNGEATYKSEIKKSFAVGDVSGECSVGGLVGSAQDENDISDVYAKSNIIQATVGGVGGVVGAIHSIAQSTNLSNCSADTRIIAGIGKIGGLSGTVGDNVKIENCNVKSNMTIRFSQVQGSHQTETNDIGGFIGFVSGTRIKSSSANTRIDALGAFKVGGFVGESFGAKYFNSYATGNISGAMKASGFIDTLGAGVQITPGDQNSQTYDENSVSNWDNPETADIAIVNAYANVEIEQVTGGAYGGFSRTYAQSEWKRTLTSCFWDKSVSNITLSSYCNGKTSQELKTKATFSGWDFDNIWSIENDSSYPFLRGEARAIQSPTATAQASASPNITETATTTATATVQASPITTAAASSTASVVPPTPTPASESTASYTFHKGFNAFGSINVVSLNSIQENGLYIYEFDGSTNSWLYYPGTSFAPAAYRGYYIYNPGSTKTVTLKFTASTSNIYNLSRGWNMFWTNREVSKNTLALKGQGGIASFMSLVAGGKISSRIFIIDNDQATTACTYFKLLTDANSDSNCSNNILAETNTMPTDKAFWIYSNQ